LELWSLSGRCRCFYLCGGVGCLDLSGKYLECDASVWTFCAGMWTLECDASVWTFCAGMWTHGGCLDNFSFHKWQGAMHMW
jgi:hypothetical protein